MLIWCFFVLCVLTKRIATVLGLSLDSEVLGVVLHLQRIKTGPTFQKAKLSRVLGPKVGYSFEGKR